MNSKNSINESLEIIRRSLEDDKKKSNNDLAHDILLLNQKINDDGTINQINKHNNLDQEINEIIDQKLNYLVETRIEKILDKKIPQILKKYFDSK